MLEFGLQGIFSFFGLGAKRIDEENRRGSFRTTNDVSARAANPMDAGSNTLRLPAVTDPDWTDPRS
jgi:hypothetical protein